MQSWPSNVCLLFASQSRHVYLNSIEALPGHSQKRAIKLEGGHTNEQLHVVKFGYDWHPLAETNTIVLGLLPDKTSTYGISSCNTDVLRGETLGMECHR
jgi:hypothetical protein